MRCAATSMTRTSLSMSAPLGLQHVPLISAQATHPLSPHPEVRGASCAEPRRTERALGVRSHPSRRSLPLAPQDEVGACCVRGNKRNMLWWSDSNIRIPFWQAHLRMLESKDH